MDLREELSEEEAWVVEAGTPTLTLALHDREVMLAWMSFRHALFQRGAIQIFFHHWLVTVEGENLEQLWPELQSQSVRTISTLDGEQEGLGLEVIAI